jgi:hypothetical protein
VAVVATGNTGGVLPSVLTIRSSAITESPASTPSAITSRIGAGSWRRCSAGRRTTPVRFSGCDG